MTLREQYEASAREKRGLDATTPADVDRQQRQWADEIAALYALARSLGWNQCGSAVEFLRREYVLISRAAWDRAPVALTAPSALEAFEGAADRLASEAVDVAMGREGGR